MQRNHQGHTLIRRILFQARQYWPHITGIFLLNLLAAPIALLKPLALKLVIDNGFGAKPLPGFIRFFFPHGFDFTFQSVILIAAGFIILIALLENLCNVAVWLLSTFSGEKLVLDFRTVLFDHIQRLSLAYHDRKGSSDALYKIQWDTVAIRTFLISNLSPLVSSFLTLLAMIIVMFLINWHFAVITLCIIPPLFILTRISTSRLRKDWDKVKDDESRAMSVIHEVLGALRVVKAFGQEQLEGERFMNKADKAIKGQMKVAWIGASFYFIVGMIFAVGTALFIYLGATYVRSGQMTIGELTLVIAYLTQIFGPLQNISKNLNDVQSSLSSLERVFGLLDREKEVEEAAHATHVQRVKGAFEFRNVSFYYDKEKNILSDVSFQIKAGDRVGILGSTGAGKSTLMSLLNRFYDPTSGEIFVDGQDIRSIKLADYRKQFSIVLQEPVLFSTTIAENIRYGRPDADEEEIIAAAMAANAHEFILRCSDGYNTMVGERGMQLSGGERQRISIARAFIKNAPVLILDEPTSSLDVKTESLIMSAIERLMEGRTTFMITHRLDTLNACNTIIHVEKGKLVDLVTSNTPAIMAEKKRAFLQTVPQV